jgi:hypothetical protein
VMTTVLVAMLKYGGNYAEARRQLADQGHIRNMVSGSRSVVGSIGLDTCLCCHLRCWPIPGNA